VPGLARANWTARQRGSDHARVMMAEAGTGNRVEAICEIDMQEWAKR
jgi:hypothetical protein